MLQFRIFTDKELVQRSLKQLVCMHLYHNLKISSHNNNTIIKPCKWWCLYNHKIKHGMNCPPILVHSHSRTFLELISPGWVVLTCQSGTHIVKWVTPHWILQRISQQQHKSSEVWSRCPCTVSYHLSKSLWSQFWNLYPSFPMYTSNDLKKDLKDSCRISFGMWSRVLVTLCIVSVTKIWDENLRRKFETKISDENSRRKFSTKISDENFRQKSQTTKILDKNFRRKSQTKISDEKFRRKF